MALKNQHDNCRSNIERNQKNNESEAGALFCKTMIAFSVLC